MYWSVSEYHPVSQQSRYGLIMSCVAIGADAFCRFLGRQRRSDELSGEWRRRLAGGWYNIMGGESVSWDTSLRLHQGQLSQGLDRQCHLTYTQPHDRRVDTILEKYFERLLKVLRLVVK